MLTRSRFGGTVQKSVGGRGRHPSLLVEGGGGLLSSGATYGGNGGGGGRGTGALVAGGGGLQHKPVMRVTVLVPTDYVIVLRRDSVETNRPHSVPATIRQEGNALPEDWHEMK